MEPNPCPDCGNYPTVTKTMVRPVLITIQCCQCPENRTISHPSETQDDVVQRWNEFDYTPFVQTDERDETNIEQYL